jgi:ribosomal protein L34E
MSRKIPDVVNCANCGRRLDPRAYMASPLKDTPEEMITRVYAPTYPYFSVHCSSCAHYTVFSYFEKDNPFREQPKD